jgi:hypothetical protein
LDASIQLRGELVEFLRQDHTAQTGINDTLSRMQELSARLENPAVLARVPRSK